MIGNQVVFNINMRTRHGKDGAEHVAVSVMTGLNNNCFRHYFKTLRKEIGKN